MFVGHVAVISYSIFLYVANNINPESHSQTPVFPYSAPHYFALTRMYSLPQTVTIPLLEIPVSMSTLIGLALLLIIFFTFFSVTFKLKGSLSAQSIADQQNRCNEGPTSFAQTGMGLLSGVESGARSAATSFERDFMSVFHKHSAQSGSVAGGSSGGSGSGASSNHHSHGSSSHGSHGSHGSS